MRLISSVVVALSVVAAPSLFGQINPANLSITGYQLISEQRVTRTQSYFTYRADVINTGPTLGPITATVTSLSPAIIVVSGKGNLHFASAVARTQTSSVNTFMLLVDRSVPTSFNSLQWSFVAPVADAGPDQTVPVGVTATLDASHSSNPSALGTLTYAWALITVPAGSHAVIQNATSVVASFAPDVLGDYLVGVTVSNGVGTDTATAKISTANSIPVADAGPNQTVTAGSTVHLDGSKSHDADGNPLTYSWTLLQTPAGSSAVLANANSVSPSFVADKIGSYLVQLIVNDGFANGVPATVTITTTPGNTPPVANAGPNQVVSVGAVVQLDGSKSTDVDENPLTYKWSLISKPAGSAAQISSLTVVNPVFTADLAGTYIAQLIVNDGFVDSTPSTVMITTGTPQAPTANAGPNQTVVHGSTVTLNGSGTDPQNLPLTYSWSLISKPAGSAAVLSSATIPGPSFLADQLGTYIAQLIVSNGVLSSAPSTVTITTTNTPPVANAGSNQNVAAGATVTLDGSQSSDADHDPLTYRWSLLSIPAGSSASLGSPNTVSPSFVADMIGIYVAQLIVNDGIVDSAPATVTINAISADALVLSPDPLNLSTLPGTLTISVGTPVGSGGLLVNLTSRDPAIASVPATATIPPGSSSTTVLVTPGALGQSTIFATASGFRPTSSSVNVSQATILLSLSANAVGISKSITGTVTLSAPTGTDVTVTLTPNTGGIVLLPATVQVNAGTTFTTFTITGAAAGTVSISAAAPGYVGDLATLTVVPLGAITVQPGVTVGIGQSVPLAVTLITPAPVGGVTINLTSDDTTKHTVTPSVVINAGATAPDVPAQVTGVSVGSANVTASAAGFSSDTKSVQVAATLSFSPVSLTLATGATQNLVLTLSGPTPAGGLTVNIASDNAGVAAVPSTVFIAPGTNTANVLVTAVGPGSAKITASSGAGIVGGSAQVTVVTGLAINAALPAGVVGAPYSATATASGGTPPYTFTATGLPAGLQISSGGQITGSPQAAGTSTPAITVTDSTSGTPQTATANPTITINPALSITTTSLAGVAGAAFNGSVSATGGTAPYSFTATGLPSGLSISPTGQITGTSPTAGSFTVAVTVTDSTAPTHLSVTANVTINLSVGLSISTSGLPNGAVGAPYSATVTAVGGTTPYTFTASGLPVGLSISPGGVISGVPQAAGTSPVVFTVTDSASGTSSATISITINPALAITTASLPNGVAGLAYSATVNAVGGTAPYTFTATGLPAGLSISPGGQISGTPSAAAAAVASITVTDSSGPPLSTTVQLNISISPAVSITTASLPNGSVNVAYTAPAIAATGGNPPYTFTATGLPAGLSISAGGQISGIPTAAGTSSVVITATDSTNPTHATGTRTLSIAIVTPLALTTTSLPDGFTQAGYSANLTATGGTPPYHWSVISGSLPPGLALDPASGAIAGTPTQAGAFPATFQVTDSASPAQSATAALTLTIQTQSSGPPIFISSVTVGQNLIAPVLITLSQPLPADTVVTISTSNAGLAALAAHAVDAGAGSLQLLTPGGTTNFSVFVQGIGNSGSATLTVSAPGYSNGFAQVTLAPSAFVLSGPNGIGGSFVTNQGVATPLTVSAAQLNSAGHVAQIQAVIGGASINVPISIADPNGGSVTPTSVTFTGAVDTLPIQFTAGTTATSTTITAIEPAGFATPAGDNVLPVTVQPATLIPSNVTVGQNLETTATVTLQGVAPNDLTVTITSSDPARLLLSPDALSPGSASITEVIKQGLTGTQFFVYGVGNSGTVTYNASASGFGNANGTVTLDRSGFVISGPFGLGQDFLTTTASAPSFLNVSTAVLGSSGNYMTSQDVAGGLSFNVNVTSANTAVGTITTSPVTIGAGNSTATTQFRPLSNGSTLISVAGPAPFIIPSQFASLTATVSTPKIAISADSVGNHLEQQGTIFLAAAPSAPLNVTLAVTSGSATLSATLTGSGSSTTTVTIAAGQFTGAFFVHGLADSGTASISADAPGYAQGTTSVKLVPSGIVIAGPDGLGANLRTTVAAGNQPVSVSTAKIDSGAVTIQPLAGGSSPLVVSLSNSNAGVGTIPGTATIAAGSDTGVIQFHPVATGSTFLSVTPPGGFQSSPQFFILEADVQ